MGVEVVGFRLDLQGWEAAGKAANDTYELKDAIYEVGAAYGVLTDAEIRHINVGTESNRVFLQSLGIFEAGSDRLAASQGAAVTRTRQLNTAMEGVANGGAARMGQGLLQAAYFADDLQYGLRGVVNNVPVLLSSLGVGAGLAGVVSIVAVGVSQLVSHWDDLLGLFGSGKIKTEAEELEELGNMLERTGTQAERYRELKAQEKAQKRAEQEKESAGDVQSSEGKKEGQRFTSLIGDALKPGQTSQDFINAFVEKRIREQTQRGFAPDANGRELIREDISRKFGRAMSGNEDDAYFLELEAKQDKTGFLKGFNDQLEAAKRKEALEDERKTRHMISHAEFESNERIAKQRKDALEEERRIRHMITHAEAASERRIAEQEASDLTKQGKMNEAGVDWDEVKRLNAQKQASKAAKKMQAAQREFALANMTPAQRRFAQQMERMQGRFNRKGSAASIAQRQMMLRMGGGAGNMKAAAEKRERAQVEFAKASKDFAQAVETLQRDGITVVL